MGRQDTEQLGIGNIAARRIEKGKYFLSFSEINLTLPIAQQHSVERSKGQSELI